MNWIVIGVGDIAKRRVIPAIQAETQSHLYGVVTRDLKKAAAYSADTRAWNDLDEALRDPAVEAVYVATPVFLHAPQTISALRAWTYVLCEKPAAMNEAAAASTKRAAAETGRTLGVMASRRKRPTLNRASDSIEQGAVGEPVFSE